MPILTASRPRPTRQLAPIIPPSAPLSEWADTAWTVAMIDAWDARDRARRAVALQERIDRGTEWLAAHDASHARYGDAQTLLRNLRDRLDVELSAVRCYQRQAWFGCVAAHGYRVNGGIPTPPPVELWRSLFGDLPPPELEYVGGALVAQRRIAAAPWMLEELREVLEMRGAACT